MGFHETIAADESPCFEGYGAELAALQKKRGGSLARALHLRAHLGVALVETLSFDAWHSIEAHRPLGAIMRARAVAYRHSVLGRKVAAEPKTVLSL